MTKIYFKTNQHAATVTMKRQMEKRAARLVAHAKTTEKIEIMLEFSHHLLKLETVNALESKLAELKSA